MIAIKFKECCRECNHVDLDTNEADVRSLCERTTKKLVVVSCKHSPVCKKYMECDEPWSDKSQT